MNLIKEKLLGKINGRTCADVSTKRGYIPREDSSSPTISIEALTANVVLDAYEYFDVAIFYLPGAYSNSDTFDEKIVRIKLEGEFVDIMCGVNLDHIPNIRFENGNKVLYLRIRKALYGCIESALLWCDIYVNTLKELGFVINPK